MSKTTRTVAAVAAEVKIAEVATVVPETSTAVEADAAPETPKRDLDAEITAGVIKVEPTRAAPFDLVTFAAEAKPKPCAGARQSSINLVLVVARIAGSKATVSFRAGLSWPNDKPNEQRAYLSLPGFGKFSYKTDGFGATGPFAEAEQEAWQDSIADLAVEYYARYAARIAAAAEAEAKSRPATEQGAPTSRKSFSLKF